MSLPVMRASEEVVQDYASLSLSIKGHPVAFLREKLMALNVSSSAAIARMPNGKHVKVAGLMLVRQQPQSSNGVVFVTMEDETGKTNIVNWASVYKQSRRAIRQARLIMVEGYIQREDVIVHVIAKKSHDITYMLKELTAPGYDDMPLLVSRADEIKHGHRGSDVGKSFIPEARNFK